MREVLEKELEEIEKIDKTETIDFWHHLEFNIDKNYEYVPKNKIFGMVSDLIYYAVGFPVIYILTKLLYDFKIEGKENLEALSGGAITVSNHILVLDCAMVGLACKMKRIYFTTQIESFKIPFVRKLIKLLRAIPLPLEVKNRERLIKELSKLLENDNLVHFYPEAELKAYCEEIREFKNGAFNLAIKNNVPIIPMVFTFREPSDLRKIFKRKKDVTLTILKPIKLETAENKKAQMQELKHKVENAMKSTAELKYKA